MTYAESQARERWSAIRFDNEIVCYHVKDGVVIRAQILGTPHALPLDERLLAAIYEDVVKHESRGKG